MAKSKELTIEPLLELMVALQLPCGHEIGTGFFSANGIEHLEDTFDIVHATLPIRMRCLAERHQCELVSEHNPYGQSKDH